MTPHLKLFWVQLFAVLVLVLCVLLLPAWVDHALAPTDGNAEFDIDLVVLWVASPTAAQLEDFADVCPDDGVNTPAIQRLRDLGVFERGIQLALVNLPWLNRIHVVTNGNFPCWLKDHSKINRVTHAEFWWVTIWTTS